MKWTEEQLQDLKNNYSYYIKNRKEAEIKFKRKWNSIKIKVIKLELENEITNFLLQLKDQRNKQWENENIQYKKIQSEKQLIIKKVIIKWTEEQLQDLKSNYNYYILNKKEAETHFGTKWNIIQGTAKRKLGLSLMKINKKCAQFLGCYVAERVLSHVFKDVKRMPINNIGYDFICNRGFKIEVKSSCLNKSNRYTFHNLHNKTADYFLLIGFDNRENLNPQHIWLIKSDEIINEYKKISEYKMLILTCTSVCLSKYLKYELTNKLKETIECCTELKLINKSKEEDLI